MFLASRKLEDIIERLDFAVTVDFIGEIPYQVTLIRTGHFPAFQFAKELNNHNDIADSSAQTSPFKMPPKKPPTSPSTSTPPTDAAMQARIITHMNTDHTESLSLFLQHYNKLSPSLATQPQLDEFTLDHMTIKSSYGRSFIPLDPPLNSYGEARQRMVLMNAEALKGLRLSDIKVTEYVPPKMGWQMGMFGLCLVAFVSFSPFGSPDLGREAAKSRVNLLYLFWSVGGLVPGLSFFAHDVATYVFVFMCVTHGGEASWLGYSKLSKHQVPAFTLVWWQWVLSCFIEGVGTFIRFDQMIKAKEEEKVKKKH